MGQNSKIGWTHHTFNPWIGCTHVHPGCLHCYAEAFAKRTGKAKWGPAGTRVKTSPDYWKQPLKWNRDAEKAGERRRVFCASLADVFEEWDGWILDSRGEAIHQCTSCVNPSGQFHRQSFKPYDKLKKSYEHICGERFFPLTLDDLRRDLFDLIDQTPWLDWLLLTKRPENIRRMWVPRFKVGPRAPGLADSCQPEKYRENVWLLTSVSNQPTAEKMIPELLKCRDLVPVLGISAEPLLGPVNWVRSWGDAIRRPDGIAHVLDWVIIGGESGGKRRPCEVAWIESLVRQCKDADVACYVKQDAAPTPGQQGRLPDHVWAVKEFPEVTCA